MNDKLRPLDLSNLLKHAFTYGFEWENAHVTTAKAWTYYDPTECVAFERVANVLKKDLAMQVYGDMTIPAIIDTEHYAWVVSVDPNKQPDRPFEEYQQAAKIILSLMNKLENLKNV